MLVEGTTVAKYLNTSNNEFHAREEYIKNYGPVNSGIRLRDFLYDTFGDQINIPRHKTDYVTIDYPKTEYAKCEL